jgi:hypothetical protein
MPVPPELKKKLEQEGIVGVSDPEFGGERKIRVYVETEEDAKRVLMEMPEVKVAGVSIKTEPIVSGRFYALSRTERVRPIIGGISCGNYKITAGTLGLIVRDKTTKKPLILSNNHVLTQVINGIEGEIEDPILQPGCYSEDTEVLTREGWKKFYELTGNEEIMTLNPRTNEIEYQKPIRIWKYWYEGKMIHWKGQMYDLLVTPEHNVWCRIHSRKKGKKITKNGENDWKLRKAYELLNYEIEFSKTGIWNCEDKEWFELPKIKGINTKQIERIPMDIWLKFFGWWISEGSVYKKKGGYGIFIRQTNKKNLEEIVEVIKKMGFKPFISKNGQVGFYSKQLYFYLKQFGHAKDKFIPRELKQLPPNKIKILLMALFKGDGCFVSSSEIKKNGYKEKYRGAFRRYTTKSKKLADDILELLIKVGLSGKVYYDKKQDIYKIGVVNRNLTPRATKQPKLVDYRGFVYDVTVPNHILMVRRNGNPIWSGNSYDGGTENDIVARLLRFVTIKLPPETNLVDAAVAEIVEGIDFKEFEIMDIGKVTGIAEAKEGERIFKSGRTTGLTQSTIFDTRATIKVYGYYSPDNYAIFEDQLISSTPFMAGGDSGSIWVNERKEVVGLGFAGSDRFSCANKIQNVINLLDIEIPTLPKVEGFPVLLPLAVISMIYLAMKR